MRQAILQRLDRRIGCPLFSESIRISNLRDLEKSVLHERNCSVTSGVILLGPDLKLSEINGKTPIQMNCNADNRNSREEAWLGYLVGAMALPLIEWEVLGTSHYFFVLLCHP